MNRWFDDDCRRNSFYRPRGSKIRKDDMKENWKDHWSKDPDRIGYVEGEITKAGLPSIDEVVIHDAHVHLECLNDNCFILIMENEHHYWHLNIFSRSGRAKIEAHLYEEGK